MNAVVMCDLDGTLIDSRQDLTTGVNLMRAEYGLPSLDVDTVTGYVGNGAKVLAEKALDGTDTDIDEALAIMKKHYSEHMFEQTSLYPGIIEGLQMLSIKNYKISVVTNKPQGPCEKILQHLKIDYLFDVIMGAGDKYELKPDPAMLLAVMEKTSALPEMSWMIGDNYTDLESGRRAGMKRCFAEYGFGRQGQEEFDLSVSSFLEFTHSLPQL